jgi:ribosomal protein L3 glutamine methyltransferase
VKNQANILQQLQTIGDFIRYGASLFNQNDCFYGHGNDNAWDEAVVLTMYALHLPAHSDKAILSCHLLDEEKQAILDLFSQRIEKKYPAAYITQQAFFADLPFYVDERVLVPRSPIGELILNKFEGLISQPPKRILDLCTGSGCIAIACSYAFPEAEVDAVDLSLDALDVAQINIESHGVIAQVIPIQSDIFSGVENEKYDLIVSNPPYVDEEDMADLPTEFQHEPALGLACGDDGLDIVRVILAEASQHLTEHGVLICEVGNSMVHLMSEYPEVPFHWIKFKQGGHGVFSLTRAELEQYHTLFEKRKYKS